MGAIPPSGGTPLRVVYVVRRVGGEVSVEVSSLLEGLDKSVQLALLDGFDEDVGQVAGAVGDAGLDPRLTKKTTKT